MKAFILVPVCLLTLLYGCVTKQEIIVVKESVPAGSMLGIVSHQYRATGCATVVITKPQNPEESITLIPRDTLPSALDVDGLEIYFNYRPLKMHNPAGCKVGMPAALTDIVKKG